MRFEMFWNDATCEHGLTDWLPFAGMESAKRKKIAPVSLQQLILDIPLSGVSESAPLRAGEGEKWEGERVVCLNVFRDNHFPYYVDRKYFCILAENCSRYFNSLLFIHFFENIFYQVQGRSKKYDPFMGL